MAETLKSVSLALSGGGVRCTVHLGVLQVLDEYNMKIEAISGSRIGSIIGSLYCSKPLIKIDHNILHDCIFITTKKVEE